MNIVESIKEDINADLLQALASANNESIDKTKLTIETSVTSLLLAFMKRASTETGLHLLHTLTSGQNFSLQSPLDSIFPIDKINKLADEGNALISKIIPDKKSPLITFVSSYSGVRNATANRTNGIVTLLILNKLKEVSASKTLDLGGLAELFADQKDFLIENAPQNLIEKLSQHIGLGNLISLGSSIITTSASLSSKNDKEKLKTSESNTKYISNESTTNSGGFNLKNWLIPGIFGLLILGLIGYYAYTEIYADKSDEKIVATDSLINVKDTSKIDSAKMRKMDSIDLNSKSDTLVVELEEQQLPNGQKISLEKNNLAFKVLSFLSDSSKTNTKNVFSQKPSFGSTGSDVLAEQTEDFANIGKIMKAFPQSRLKVVVSDYVGVDSVFNDKRGNKRAFSIKKILMNNNIMPLRIDAYGKIVHSAPTDNSKSKEVEITIMKK